MGTLYLLVPKTRNGGYILFFITERKRSEATLVEVVQEAFVQGVSTRKIEKTGQATGDRKPVTWPSKRHDERAERTGRSFS